MTNSSIALGCVETNPLFLEVIRQCRMLCRPLYLLQADPASQAFRCWLDVLRAPSVAEGVADLSPSCQADPTLQGVLGECDVPGDLDDASWPELFALVVNVSGTAPPAAEAVESASDSVDILYIVAAIIVLCLLLLCCCWFCLFQRQRRREVSLQPHTTANPLWPPEPPRPVDWRAELESRVRGAATLNELYGVKGDIASAVDSGRIPPAEADRLKVLFSARAAALFTHTIKRMPEQAQLHGVGKTIEGWAAEGLFTEPDAEMLKALFVGQYAKLQPPSSPRPKPQAQPRAAAAAAAPRSTVRAKPKPLSFQVSSPEFQSAVRSPDPNPLADPDVSFLSEVAETEFGADGAVEASPSSPRSEIRSDVVSPRSSTRRKGSTRRPVGQRGDSPDTLAPPQVVVERRERTASIRKLKDRGMDRYVSGLEHKTAAELKELVEQSEAADAAADS